MEGSVQPTGTPSAGASSTSPGSPASPSPEPPVTNSNLPTASTKRNLLEANEGARIVGASEAAWKEYIFGDRRPSCAIISTEGFVVLAFRDEHRARFDRLGVFIEATDRNNVKTVEIYASDTTDRGPFTKVFAFEAPNFRNERQPFHEFPFEAVTARYVKVVVSEFRSGRDSVNGNVCTMELYGSLE